MCIDGCIYGHFAKYRSPQVSPAASLSQSHPACLVSSMQETNVQESMEWDRRVNGLMWLSTETNHLQAHVVDLLHELVYSDIVRSTHQCLMVQGRRQMSSSLWFTTEPLVCCSLPFLALSSCPPPYLDSLSLPPSPHPISLSVVLSLYIFTLSLSS